MSDQHDDRGVGTPLTRREAVTIGLALAAGGTLAAGSARPAAAAARAPASAVPAGQATPAAGAQGDRAAAIVALAREAMENQDLKAVIVRVTIDGQELVTAALGESMTGVPATPEMRFRNGAVAISYVATLLLRLVDQRAVGLDDALATWLPDLPDADRVTLRMLANMTAGYPDYAPNGRFVEAVYADPFRWWSPDELIAIGLSTPRASAPGANWDYSHTNYVILGQALERIAGKPLATLLQEQVLTPMGLRHTVASSTAEIPEPALHAFSSERSETLGIAPGARYYEESTYLNPSWTLAEGAIQTTNIVDMTATAVAIGEGTLLSPKSHAAQVEPRLLGFGAPWRDARPARRSTRRTATAWASSSPARGSCRTRCSAATALWRRTCPPRSWRSRSPRPSARGPSKSRATTRTGGPAGRSSPRSPACWRQRTRRPAPGGEGRSPER